MNKRLLQNILLLLISTVLSLFVLEFLFRFALYGTNSLSVKKMNSIHPLGVSGTIQPSPYPELIFEFKPNLDTYFKLAKLQTNSQGFRDKEYSKKKPENTFRVAVIGDSFVMPAGVEIEDAFHSLLEERLSNEDSNLTFEFINFGVGGYNLRQYLGVLNYKAQQYDPDMVIVGFCPRNDHSIPPEEIFQKPYQPKAQTYPFYHSLAKEALITLYKQRMAGSEKVDTSAKKEVLSKPRVAYLSDIFSKMSQFGQEKNIPIIVAKINVQSYGEDYLRLEEIVTSSGLRFVDLGLNIKGEKFLDYTIYPIDQHPNDKAHQIFSEKLYDYLIGNKMLDKRSVN